jgi:hypothetical protein
MLLAFQGSSFAIQKHLDCNSDMAASSGRSGRTHEVHHRTNELLINYHAVSDGQSLLLEGGEACPVFQLPFFLCG